MITVFYLGRIYLVLLISALLWWASKESGKTATQGILWLSNGDICAYLALGNQVISVELKRACSGYYPQVFVFTPKQEIYQQDSERPHTFAEAMVIHQQLVATYQQLGYQVVEVPWER